MKPITLTIYRDGDGVTSIVTGNGDFMGRFEMRTLLKDIEHFYQGMSDNELDKYIEYAKTRAQANSKRRGKSGYIYLLESYDGFFKIGKAMNPRDRVQHIQMPYQPRLIHTIPVTDMNWSEKQLHLKYAHKRGSGEWFLLDGRDVAYIKSLTSLDEDS